MTDQHGPFPPPPRYYLLYTDENLSQLSEEEEPKNLGPPPPLTTSHQLFGVNYEPHYTAPTLESSGFKDLVDETQPLPTQIKTLIITATRTYSRYIQQLYNDTQESKLKEHVQNMQDLLVNAVHLIGTYRTDQALRAFQMIVGKLVHGSQGTSRAIEQGVSACTLLMAELGTEPGWSEGYHCVGDEDRSSSKTYGGLVRLNDEDVVVEHLGKLSMIG